MLSAKPSFFDLPSSIDSAHVSTGHEKQHGLAVVFLLSRSMISWKPKTMTSGAVSPIEPSKSAMKLTLSGPVSAAGRWALRFHEQSRTLRGR